MGPFLTELSPLRFAAGAAAILVAHHLAHQHRTGGPLAAEPQTVERAKRLEIDREGAQEGEERVPEDGDLEHFYPAKLVGQGPGEPSPQGRDQQRHGADKAGLAARQSPQRDHRRDHKAVHLDVERIEGPAAEAAPRRLRFLGVQLSQPPNMRSLPNVFGE